MLHLWSLPNTINRLCWFRMDGDGNEGIKTQMHTHQQQCCRPIDVENMAMCVCACLVNGSTARNIRLFDEFSWNLLIIRIDVSIQTRECLLSLLGSSSLEQYRNGRAYVNFVGNWLRLFRLLYSLPSLRVSNISLLVLIHVSSHLIFAYIVSPLYQIEYYLFGM